MEEYFIYSINFIDLVIKKEFDDQVIFFVMIECISGQTQEFCAFFQVQTQSDAESKYSLFGRMVVF